MNFQEYVEMQSLQFQQHLKFILQRNDKPAISLFEAINYSVLNGGKYFRPLIIYCTGDSFGIQTEKLDPLAVAVELIHAYSLIHDDLPAMDNAQIRRGKPSCHLKFGEAEAILAGDALQMLAIEVIATAMYLSDRQKLKLIHLLTNAAGANGMVGGQSLDIHAEGKQLSLEKLQEIHQLKTGKMIEVSIMMPVTLAENSAKLELAKLASLLGIAYQIQDDLLDIESNTTILGKESGIDNKLLKCTYPKLMGLAESKQQLLIIKQEIQHILATQNLLNTKLDYLVKHIFNRKN